MELILVAVALMILLTAFDADLWPKAMARHRGMQEPHPARREGPRRRPRHPLSPGGQILRLASSRRAASSGARWWWE